MICDCKLLNEKWLASKRIKLSAPEPMLAANDKVLGKICSNKNARLSILRDKNLAHEYLLRIPLAQFGCPRPHISHKK